MDEKIVKPISSPVQQAPVEVAASEPEITEATNDEPARVTEQDYRTSPLFYQVADYFSLEPHEYDSAKNKISVIVDWAAQAANSSNTEDILLKLRETEEKVARLDPFEKRYKMMFRYVMLKGKEQSIKKALSAFEKGGV